MSQTGRKRDIADFFRPYAKTISKKRPTPEPDEDTIIVNLEGSSPKTPSTTRRTTYRVADWQQSTTTPSPHKPLTNPRTDGRLSIPIRSPVGLRRTEEGQERPVSRLKPAQKSKETSTKPSTFSSADTQSPSRNIAKDGKLVEVQDSDDDDNDSLASLTDILEQKKDVAEEDVSGVRVRHEAERSNLLSRFSGGRSNPILKKDKMRELQRREQAVKNQWSELMQEDIEDEQDRVATEAAKALLEAATKEIEEHDRAELNKKVLADMISGNVGDGVDQEQLDRVMEAVERTEAFTQERIFSFFDRSGPRKLLRSRKKRKEFPPSAVPASLWILNDHAAHARAFGSGFMTEVARRGKLDDAAIRWTFDELFTEPQDDLRHAYISVVSAASPSWTRSSINPEDIQITFDALGADASALSESFPVNTRPEIRRKETQKPDYKSLLVTLDVFRAICGDMDFPCLTKLTAIVSRLTLDQKVMSDHRVCRAVVDLLEALTNMPDPASQSHVHERLTSDLTTNIQEPELQALFLKHLPVTSPATARLRSNLACIFLLGEQTASRISSRSSTSTAPTPVQIITKALQLLPAFTTKPQTRILDAAIADGYAASPFASRADEQAFNADVDALAEHIRSLFVSIADTGASHMRRTEAKDTLQALHYRLLSSVRTKTRRKRHVFDAHGNFTAGQGLHDSFEAESEAKGKEFMSKFLKKKVKEEDEELLDVFDRKHRERRD